MKFIILSEDYPPAPGGIAQWARGVAHALAGAGHAVTVITRLKPGATLTSSSAIRLIKLPTRQWANFRLLYLYGTAYRAILRERPDVVIATTWQLAAILIPGRKRFGYRVVTVYHGLEVTRALTARRKRSLRNTVADSALNIAVSRFTRDHLCQKLGLSEHRIHVVPNGVDLTLFRPGPPDPHLQDRFGLTGRKVVLTLSRVIERKGHDVVIKALPALLADHPRLLYLIAGAYRQDFYDYLNKLIDEKGLRDHVRFTGRLEDADLPNIYNLCDIYIMVSKGSGEKGDSEGFGITYLEANACEKPVIGSNVDGIPDAVVHGLNGLLVPPDDIEATGHTLDRLLRDDDLRNKLGRGGRERIRQAFTWDTITDRILKLLDNSPDE